jgi:serine/threonine-protein kinase
MPSGSERWQQLQEVFEAACALPPESRPGFLEGACQDAALRVEVEAMLAADQPNRALSIERLVRDGGASTDADDPIVGMRLGPWLVQSVAGRGGMGTVYVAARADGQYEQRVALKIVSSGVPAAPAARRLEAEKHILARLSHPNIARLLDAGLTPEGTPYIVMEYVDGVSITEHCESRALKLADRLRLLRVVCDATQHAHQALVVHRDLKPSNIFVSRDGEVKLLDFGIAKLLEPEGSAYRGTTRGVRALTPEYAAPELMAGRPVTTATDVYALGVVLWELVTGKRPLPDASKPDTRLPGDLDQVASKALRPEPERRYASAGQFAEDIDRFLEGRPVVARPDTFVYRARRFVSRNKVASAAAALFAIVLIAFGIVATIQARRVAIERDRARLEQSKSEQVVRLLIDLFQTANPQVVPGGDRLSIGEFLGRAETRVLGELESQPELGARVRHVLGLMHHARSDGSRASTLLNAALADSRRISGEDALETLTVQTDLGDLLIWQGEHDRARALLDDALARIVRTLGDDHLLAARVYNRLARLQPTLDDGGPYLERSVAIARRRLAPNDPERISYISALAVFHGRKQPDEARRLFDEALQAAETLNGGRSTLLVRILNDSATFDGRVADFARAEAKHRRSIALAADLVGGDSWEVANGLNNLAVALANQGGRAREVVETLQQSYELHLRIFGPSHWRTINTMRNVGTAYRLAGDAASCESWMRRAVSAADSADDKRPAPLMRAQLANCVIMQHRLEEGIALLRTAVAQLRAQGNDDAQGDLSLVSLWLGRVLIDEGRLDEADPLVTAAAEHHRRLPDSHPSRAQADCELARLFAARGRNAEALTLAESCVPHLKNAGQLDAARKRDAERLLAKLRANRQ